MSSYDDLNVERGRLTTRMADIINTSKMMNGGKVILADDERYEFEMCGRQFDEISNRMARLYASGPQVPRVVNSTTDGFESARSLDALLWATADEVVAGSITKKGVFQPDQRGARNAVDRVTVRSDSMLLEAPRIADLAPESHRAVRNFQELVADMTIFGLLVDKYAMSSAHGFEVARGHKLFADRWQNAMRALDVDTAGDGANWVPTGIGAALHEKVRAAGKIAPLLVRIDLPTNPWKWPIEGGDATAYRVAEPTTDTASKVTVSTPGTVAPTFDAEIFGGRVLFSRSIEADSAVAITGYTRMKLVRAFVDAEEKAILDGDTAATHQDADVEAIGDIDPRTAWDGFRKKAIAQTLPAVAQTATSVANLGLLRAAMGKWGLNPSDLVFIVGVSAMHDLLNDTSLTTFEKMGPHATILNGQIGSVYGVPVVVSEHVREDLNASGVQDGITQTKTYNICVNRGEWALGQRMALDVEIDDSIYRESFQRVCVAFERIDLQHLGDAAANDDTAIAYNITP